jgi:hypothetical protein
MPKQFFNSLPLVGYDINNDGNIKTATNILTRIAKKASLAIEGSIFYNYPMQDGDTVEIIADKYYGNPKYHWVVMLINNAQHNVYDFPLNTRIFDRYIVDKYGSYEEAVGITKTLSDANTYSSFGVYSETHNEIQTTINNPLLVSGTIPAGSTTTIKATAASDPFSTLGVGNMVELFVPSAWHDVNNNTSEMLGYSHPAEILAKSTRSDGTYAISTNMDSRRYPAFDWQEDGFLKTESGVTSQVTPPGTANQTHIWLSTDTEGGLYATNGFITFTETPGEGVDSASLVGNNFPIESYDETYNTVTLGENYKLPEVFKTGWAYTITYGGYHITSGDVGDVRIEGDDITLRSAVHHFEMDVYSGGGTLLLKDHQITKNEYVNSSVGTAANKRIVNNYDFEVEDDNSKRNIILLRLELLPEFVKQFTNLLSGK